MLIEKKRTSAGAVFLLIIAALGIAVLAGQAVEGYFQLNNQNILYILEILAYIFFAAMQLSHKQGFLLTLSAGLLTALYAWYTLQDPSYVNLLWLAAMAILTMSTLDALPFLRKLGFLPGLLVITAGLMGTVEGFLTATELGMDPLAAVCNALGNFVVAMLQFLAFLLSGLWISHPTRKEFVPLQPVYQPPMPSPPSYGYPPPVNPTASQELQRYQQMLSGGVITQEEYEGIRKRIMGR